LDYFSDRITEHEFVVRSLQLSCAPKLETIVTNDGHEFGETPEWELGEILGVYPSTEYPEFCI
jgi:hypothetical protein